MIFVFSVQLACDYYIYREVLFPFYRNFIFNIYTNQSSRWGTGPYYYYIYNSFCFFLQTLLPAFFVGLVRDKQTWKEFIVFLLYFVAFSLVPHKESRFLYPVCPFLLCITGRGLHYLFSWKVLKKIYAAIIIICYLAGILSFFSFIFFFFFFFLKL
jgi:hypothetical protein